MVNYNKRGTQTVPLIFFCRQINVKIYMLLLMIFVYNHSMQKHGHNDYYWNLTKYMKILKIYDKIHIL